VLDPDLEVIWRRLDRRNREPGEAVIDRATLESYLPYWHPPTAAERAAWD
jgi:hypothetical protein